MKYKSIALYIVTIVILMHYLVNASFAQNPEQLLRRATTESGVDAIYIQHFSFSHAKVRRNRPNPVKKYNVELEEGITYRFNLVNGNRMPERGLMQLFYKSQLIASSLDYETGECLSQFDFHCEFTAQYQFLMSFAQGKTGFALAVLSMVIDDSTHVFDSSVSPVIKEKEILYVDHENELSIAATGVPGGSLDVSISQGEILKTATGYLAIPKHEGIAIVKVISRTRKGEINEVGLTEFVVKPLPPPILRVAVNQNNHISVQNIRNNPRPLLASALNGIPAKGFQLLEFSVSLKRNGTEGIRSSNGKFSQQQIQLLENLESGSHFYITQIRIKDKSGKISLLGPTEFIIQ